MSIKNPNAEVDTNKRIVVISLSGNIGKTVLTRFMFEPRMPQASVYNVETINKDNKEKGVVLSGRKFQQVLSELMSINTGAIVDVGASNVEEVLRDMSKMEGSHEDVDYFVIPVTPDEKPMREAVKTAHELCKMGVESEKIRVVFNKVQHADDIDMDFERLLYGMSNLGIPVNKKACVLESNFYDNFANLNMTLDELINQDSSKIKERLNVLRQQHSLSKNEQQEQDNLVTVLSMHRLAKSTVRNLDRAFYEVFTN